MGQHKNTKRDIYRLPPIPPFRGGSACPSYSSTGTNKLSSSPSHKLSTCAESDGVPTSPDERRQSILLGSSSPLNHIMPKKRPTALNKPRLSIVGIGNAQNANATSWALAPPTPIATQSMTASRPTSPALPSPSFPPGNPGVPLRFQPKKMLQGKAFTATLKAAQANKRLSGAKLTDIGHPSDEYPFPPMNLTPPPTPDGAHPVKVNMLKNGALPPSPSASPTSFICQLPEPSTVSGKALQHHKLQSRFRQLYELGDELGSGGFGFVVRAVRLEDGLLCAVKFIYKAKVPDLSWVKDRYCGDDENVNGVERTVDGFKRVPLEAYVLKTIRHRGVVSFVDLFEDDLYMYLVMKHHGSPWQGEHGISKANTSPSAFGHPPDAFASVQASHLGLLMARSESPQSMLAVSPQNPPPPSPNLAVPKAPPMMRRSSCDLFECIEQHSRLSETQAKYVFAQLIDVVGCLHYNGFVHRDIKDENIVIDHKFRVKLVDFGSTYLFDFRNRPEHLDRFFGTMAFAAPEILRDQTYQPLAAEVWSLGILLAILVTGESIFSDVVAVKNYNPSPPTTRLSMECWDIMQRCLAENPEDRWNCFRLRHHVWLADCQWQFSCMPGDVVLDRIDRVRRPM